MDPGCKQAYMNTYMGTVICWLPRDGYVLDDKGGIRYNILFINKLQLILIFFSKITIK
jgi:hypothetical protein